MIELTQSFWMFDRTIIRIHSEIDMIRITVYHKIEILQNFYRIHKAAPFFSDLDEDTEDK